MCGFYKWAIEKYFNKKTVNGDFAYDLWRDKDTVYYENDDELFEYLKFIIHDKEVEKTYRRLRKKYLKEFFFVDRYKNSKYEKEDKKYFKGETND